MKKWLVFIFLGALSAVVEANVLERIDILIKGGAPNLALRLMEAHQPDIAQQQDWMQWERQRMAIYASQNDWAAIVERIERLPKELPVDFIEEMWLKAAAAQLAAGNGSGARRYLRRLIWGQRDDIQATAPWRKMVVRTYLVDDAIEDANIAIRRFQQDFKPRDDNAWYYLHGRVLLRTGDHTSAMKLMAQRQTHEGRLLYLLARLRSGKHEPARVIQKARALEKETRKRPEINRRVWALLAEAAAKSQDAALEVISLERALPVADRLFEIGADDLWTAYERYGEALGNKAHLLIGDEAAWFEQAKKYNKKAPSRARAVYALLATKSQGQKARDRGHLRLLRSLYASGYDKVARSLYTESSRYPAPQDLPAAVRYFLSDKALEAYDVRWASRLVEGLDEPPPGEAQQRWLLRRARLAIYAGDYARGIGVIDNILAEREQLTSAEAEEMLQVVFDLQATRNYAQAYTLFERIHGLVRSKRLKRETLFWMAESRASAGDYQEAAELFLRSAVYKQPDGADIWGQTARYSAAEALGKAGLTDDARNVYTALLKITRDSKRRSIIERNMQQLWLPGSPATTP